MSEQAVKRRYYVHGDLHETRPDMYFCARCDMSAPPEHFADAVHVETRAKIYVRSLDSWNRIAKAKGSIYYRPDDVKNIISESALADVAAAKAARSPFFRWLLRQLDRDDPIGDLARDASSDSSFPATSNSREAIRSHLRSRRAVPEALVALDEGWAEFERKGKARSGIPIALRFIIFKRDSYRCQLCGASAQNGRRLEVDHKVAVANGGSSAPANLWTLCFDCNRGKGVHEL